MSRSRAEYLINKLISNELSREELDELLAGLGKEAVLEAYSDILERYFEYLVSEQDEPSDRAIYPLPENSRSEPAPSEAPGPSTPGGNEAETASRPFYTYFGRVAAVIVLLLSIGAVVYFNSRTKNDIHRAEQSLVPGKLIPTMEEAARRGQRKNVQLSDGSTVKLNSDSRIHFPEVFGTGRKVALRGEAYFEVQRDTSRPFAIALADLNVRVLGTSFDIKSYAEEDEVVVTVRTGKVSVGFVENGSSPVVLTQNQKLVYRKSTEKYRISTVNADQEISWINGNLQFNNTPLRSVERTLERWYNVDIVVEDSSLYLSSFTGTHLNESLTSVLESISFAVNAKYVIKGNTIYIRS